MNFSKNLNSTLKNQKNQKGEGCQWEISTRYLRM